MFEVLTREYPDSSRIPEHDQLSAMLNCKQYRSVRNSAKTCFEILRN